FVLFRVISWKVSLCFIAVLFDLAQAEFLLIFRLLELGILDRDVLFDFGNLNDELQTGADLAQTERQLNAIHRSIVVIKFLDGAFAFIAFLYGILADEQARLRVEVEAIRI